MGSIKITQRHGFSLIEILVALAIVAILVSVGAPRFKRAGPSAIKKLSNSLNVLMQEATQGAIESGALVKVFIKQQEGDRTITATNQAKQVIKTISISPLLIIRQFYFDKKRGQANPEEMWYFINADGIAQEVILQIEDTQEHEQDANRGTYTLILNPFSAQFSIAEGYLSPE